MKINADALISAYESRIKALEALIESYETNCKALEASSAKWRTEAFELLAQLKAKEELMQAMYRLLNP